MNMSEREWRNRYIDLTADDRERIVAAESNKLTPEECARVQSRIKAFERTVVELGSGSGIHLVTRAEMDPETLHIGFELRYKRAFKTAQKAERLGLSNVCIVRGDATSLENIAEVASLAGVYVNFPDPWDKKKWHKHRLLNPEYIAVLVRLLRPEGFISYKTDHLEYFEATLQIFEEHPQLTATRLSRDLEHSPYASENVQSEFEKLFISKQLPVYHVEVRRLSTDSKLGL